MSVGPFFKEGGRGSRKFRPEAEIFGIFSIEVAPKKLTMREKIKETILRLEHADLVKNGVPGLAYSPHEKAVREERLRMLQADLSNYCANNLFS